MTKKSPLISILILLLVTHAAADADNPTDSKEKESKPKPVSITLFIPGLQQLKNKQYIKGGILLGAFIGSVTGALVHNEKGNDWYEQYRNSTNVEEIVMLREKTEKSFKKRNLYIAGIFSVWALHIIDLKFFKSGKAGVKGEVGKNTISIGFYYCF